MGITNSSHKDRTWTVSEESFQSELNTLWDSFHDRFIPHFSSMTWAQLSLNLLYFFSDETLSSCQMSIDTLNHTIVVPENTSEHEPDNTPQTFITSSPCSSGIHRWTIKLQKLSGECNIGICCFLATIPQNEECPSKFVGSEEDFDRTQWLPSCSKGSISLSNYGRLYIGQNGFPFSPSYREGDVVTCLLDLMENSLTFSINEIKIGKVELLSSKTPIVYYPSVSLRHACDSVLLQFQSSLTSQMIYSLETILNQEDD
ncbi:hypothetical protein BLNAU_12656 [Blattamonas nauphoetae]|uniref:B30.2/SPRY domain-containing protein n=1 Tax=Blattamonas nauphoetae TaxID=2049346 RepID=A0ABQ9XLN9_9EUKA|nr:hypothetical protein BLNAU_12656 [Blattamonas nauphoetae]